MASLPFALWKWLSWIRKIWFLKSVKLKKTVPGTGLEPAHLAAYAPETYVSTNFTIRALSSSKLYSIKCLGLNRSADRLAQTNTQAFYNEFKFTKNIVPGTGLEPAQLAPYAPQTYVSTNFTTRANLFSGAAKVTNSAIVKNKSREKVFAVIYKWNLAYPNQTELQDMT